MYYIGIDPGKKGSMTILYENNDIVVCPFELYNNWKAVYTELPSSERCFAVIERAQAMPGQGVVSMFSFGGNFVGWLATIEIADIRHEIVHSRVWTKEMLKGAPGTGKDRAYNVARRLFPQWQPKLKKEREYADSILLAEYCRRRMGK